MRPRFLADADLNFAIVLGFRRREPSGSFLPAKDIIPDAMTDPDVLALAADLDLVLVSHDYETMPGHFYRFLELRESPGIVLIPQRRPVAKAIEELRVAWGF